LITSAAQYVENANKTTNTKNATFLPIILPP
jgi:hypothetical protein